MVGEIISEWRARSNRKGGRDHSGIAGDIERNQHEAEQRKRANNLLFPDSTAKHPKKDPIGIYPTPLPRSEVHKLTAGLEVKRDYPDMPELEWRRLVGRHVAHNMVVYRRLAAELRGYQDMPVLELRRLVGRFVALTNPEK